MDPDSLPESLHRPGIEEAVEVLEMLTQDEIRRAMYEDREKARRDAASWQTALERLRQEADRARQDADRAKQDAANSHVQGELIGQILAYERVLGQTSTRDELAAMSLDELKHRLEQLEVQLNGE